MILNAFRRSSHNRNVQSLYGAIVAQARSPAFYAGYGVADSVEGRFELIVLHLVLVLRRLGGEPIAAARSAAGGSAIGQQLFDAFCRDLDDNLREMGVGDTAVPRRMRAFGEAFYGRQAAYCEALDAADERELEKALARNIFGLPEADDGAVWLARYARAAVGQLAGATDEALLAGRLTFPGTEAFAQVGAKQA
jgi:cytochrome b pre-mRNA-processing protein 3